MKKRIAKKLILTSHYPFRRNDFQYCRAVNLLYRRCRKYYLYGLLFEGSPYKFRKESHYYIDAALARNDIALVNNIDGIVMEMCGSGSRRTAGERSKFRRYGKKRKDQKN